MQVARLIICLALAMLDGVCAQTTSEAPKILVGPQSIRVNGVELRTVGQPGEVHYISLAAAEKLLGKPQDIYPAGLGVGVYSWRDIGIHLQKGWRGVEKGKLFKFQVWFVDYYDKAEGKHSGRFAGRVIVEGMDVSPKSTLNSLRPELEKKGFSITEHPGVIQAERGGISIFTVGTTPEIERVEAWCSF